MKKLSVLFIVPVALLLTACLDTGESSSSSQQVSDNTASTGSSSTAAGGWGDAPDFRYVSFDGGQANISDYLGTPLVVNFWAAWCPPCKQELPSFQRIYEKYGGQFEILAIAVDDRGNPADYFRSNGFTFKSGQDIDGAAKYVGSGIPVTVFIDRNGNKINSHLGMMTEQQFEAELKKIL
jgi:thiol-disulfide isomerase/thioredoxin